MTTIPAGRTKPSASKRGGNVRDLDLMARTARGERGAFEQLYLLHHDRLFGFFFV